MTSRRGLLKLIGMAPIAGPVAAKEAAVSMGLMSTVGSAMYQGGMPGFGGSPIQSDGESWVKRQIKALFRPAKKLEWNIRAKDVSRRLDPDIASFRSISPSAAYVLQCERSRRRVEAEEMEWLDTQLQEEIANKIGF